MSDLFKYIVQIILVCLVTFGVHIMILTFMDKPLFDNQIITAYVGNVARVGYIYSNRTLKSA